MLRELGPVLALSLSEAGLAVGLSRPQAVTGSPEACRTDLLVLAGPDRHSETLLPAVDTLLKSCRCSLQDLAGIAFDAGPGGFTRVRVACAVAQGLALGANLPVLAVESLQAIALASAEGLQPGREQQIAVCMDARMGECYVGLFDVQEGRVKTREAAGLVAVEDLADRLDGLARHGGGTPLAAIAGDALNRYTEIRPPENIEVVGVPDGADLVRAMLTLATPQAAWCGPDDARPHYVRHKVALNVEEQAARRRAAAGDSD